VETIVILRDLRISGIGATWPLHRVDALRTTIFGASFLFKGKGLLQVARIIVREALDARLCESDAGPERRVAVLVGEIRSSFCAKGWIADNQEVPGVT